MSEADEPPKARGIRVRGNKISNVDGTGISLGGGTAEEISDNEILNVRGKGIEVRDPHPPSRERKWFELWWGIFLLAVASTVIGSLIVFAVTGLTG